MIGLMPVDHRFNVRMLPHRATHRLKATHLIVIKMCGWNASEKQAIRFSYRAAFAIL